VDWAEDVGLIREDDGSDEPGPPWTKTELRERLENDGCYEDGEVTVSIREVP